MPKNKLKIYMDNKWSKIEWGQVAVRRFTLQNFLSEAWGEEG
jgi:hypothetical protein